MEGLIPDETHEGINGRGLNPEPSNPSGPHIQINDVGKREPGDEAETSSTRESQRYFTRPRKNISYRYR
jgi:hypothetical protein